MYVFYSLLLLCAALLSLPWWIVQMLRLGKYRSGLGERLGFVPARLNDVKPGCIWVHAGMALVRPVGPHKHAIDIVIAGRLQFVPPRRDVLDLHVLEHQCLVAVI